MITIFPITYYATHATPDYRQPVEPEVVVLVTMGILSLRRMVTPVALVEETMEEEESQLAMSMSSVGSFEVG